MHIKGAQASGYTDDENAIGQPSFVTLFTHKTYISTTVQRDRNRFILRDYNAQTHQSQMATEARVPYMPLRVTNKRTGRDVQNHEA